MCKYEDISVTIERDVEPAFNVNVQALNRGISCIHDGNWVAFLCLEFSLSTYVRHQPDIIGRT